jgi:dethiobiotin synthetase/adenosylmethionine--8-amino-7-oxononanoate aminotransferase
MQSTIPLLGATPDISVNAKILTGGLVPLATTLASDSIFRAFYGPNKAEALLHGHSYTAHALGCEVANESMKLIEKATQSEAWLAAQARWQEPGTRNSVWSFWDPEFVQTVSSMDTVAEVMALGTVLAIKVKDSGAGMPRDFEKVPPISTSFRICLPVRPDLVAISQKDRQRITI